MNRPAWILVIAGLVLAFAARGEEGPPPGPPAEEGIVPPPPPTEISPGSREGRGHRGPRGPEGFRSRFREELESMRKEIQKTRALIGELEEKIAAASGDEERQELRRRLDEALRHSAEIQLTLARKKVEITRQALEFSRKRYDQASRDLTETTERLRRQYPDLVVPPTPPRPD